MRLFDNAAFKIELFPSRKDTQTIADAVPRQQNGESKRAPRTEQNMVKDNSAPAESQQARHKDTAPTGPQQSRHLDPRAEGKDERLTTDAASDKNERLQKQYDEVYISKPQSTYSQSQPQAHVPRDEGTRAKPNASKSQVAVSASDYEPVRGKAVVVQTPPQGLRRTGSARNLQKDQPETNHAEVRRARSYESVDNGKHRTNIPRGAPHSTSHALRKPRSRVELAKASENMARTLSRSPARGSPARRPGNSLRATSSDERPGTSGTSGSGTSKLAREVDVSDQPNPDRGREHLVASDDTTPNTHGRSGYQATRNLPEKIVEEVAGRDSSKHHSTESKGDGVHGQLHLTKDDHVAEAQQHASDSNAANSTPETMEKTSASEQGFHRRHDSKITTYSNANKGLISTVESQNASAAQQVNPHSSAHMVTAGSGHPSGLRAHPKTSDEHNIRVKLPPSSTSHGSGDRKVTNFSRPSASSLRNGQSDEGTTSATSRAGASSSMESCGVAPQYRPAKPTTSSSTNRDQSHASILHSSETADLAKPNPQQRTKINSVASQALDFATRSSSKDGTGQIRPKKDYISSSGAKGPGNKYVDSSNSTRSPFNSLFVDNTSGVPKDPRTVGVTTSDKGTGKVKYVKKVRSKDRVNGAGHRLPHNGSVGYAKEDVVRDGKGEVDGKRARKDSGQSHTDYAESRELGPAGGHEPPPPTPAKIVRVGI